MLQGQRLQSSEGFKERIRKNFARIGKIFPQQIKHEEHIHLKPSLRYLINRKGKHQENGKVDAPFQNGIQADSCQIIPGIEPGYLFIGQMPVPEHFFLIPIDAQFLSCAGLFHLSAVIFRLCHESPVFDIVNHQP